MPPLFRLTALATAVLTIFNLVSVAQAQDITTDPFVRMTIDRGNFEPGGRYDSYPRSRGVIDPASRTGQVNIVRNGSVRLGSFSLQSAIINGEYRYTLRFGNHPFTEHSPFDSVSARSDSVRENRPDGGQSSVALNWTAYQNHPADGYDGVQGGGYPSPTGARDEYRYSIDGIATGVYPLLASELQASERPGFGDRTENYGRGTIEEFGQAGDRFGQGVSNLFYRYGWSNRAEGALDVGLSVRDALFSGLNSFLSAYVGPEANLAYETAATYVDNQQVAEFRSQPVEWQVANLNTYRPSTDYVRDALDNIRQLAAENPLYYKTLDAVLTAYFLARPSGAALDTASYETSTFAQAAARNAMAQEIGILRDAVRGKGNFGIGTATGEASERLGRAWVGDGYTISSDGKILISKDGLRQYRPPSLKSTPLSPTGVQANFEQRNIPNGPWQSNGHLDIKD